MQFKREANVPPELQEKIEASWQKKVGSTRAPQPRWGGFIVGNTHIAIVQGDITTQPVEAIVNAANPACLGGSGVDGAIHAAAGGALLNECRALPEKEPNVRCRTGEAVITGKGALPDPIQHVIHTVGPVWNPQDPEGSMQMLKRAYRSSLELAMQRNLKSVAFPAVSAGIYGFGIHRSMLAGIQTAEEFAHEHPDKFQEIRFVVQAGSYDTAVRVMNSFVHPHAVRA